MYVCLGKMTKSLDQREWKFQDFRVYTWKNVGATIPTSGGGEKIFLYKKEEEEKGRV